MEIRIPTANDLSGILELVQSCQPAITPYIPYYYWMTLRYFHETCAIAEISNEIVGWCLIIPVPGEGRYFLHQLAVAPRVRQKGTGTDLVIAIIRRIKKLHTNFELEFTVERKNSVTKLLAEAVAKEFGMRIVQRPDLIDLLSKEPSYREELYALTAIS